MIKLSDGSAGIVYLADNKSYVIKQTRPGFSDRTAREYKINMMLHENGIIHPNLLHIRNVDPSFSKMEMDYCAGGDLYEYIQFQDMKDNNLEEALHILKQLMLGLEYMHSKNVIHRDIKTENILLVYPKSTEHIKICDFGWSCIYDKDNPPIERAGTFEIMCYEMCDCDSYDHRADIWSLAVVIYEYITNGYTPFLSSDEHESYKISQDDIQKKLNILIHVKNLEYFAIKDAPLWPLFAEFFSNIFVRQQDRWSFSEISTFIQNVNKK